MRKEKGFSMIELVIAMAIIGILAAIAIPTYVGQKQRTYESSAASDVRHLYMFESSFYNDHLVYVAVVPSDKVQGIISKTITLNNGSTALFEISTLTPATEVAVNIDGTKQYANIAAYHPGGSNIIARESDGLSDFRKTPFDGTLTSGDVPAATSGNDLSSWEIYQ